MLTCTIIDVDDPAVPDAAWCHPDVIGAASAASGGGGSTVVGLAAARDAAQSQALKAKLQAIYERQAAYGMRLDGFWGSLFRQVRGSWTCKSVSFVYLTATVIHIAHCHTTMHAHARARTHTYTRACP
jgi:hypothetical protein